MVALTKSELPTTPTPSTVLRGLRNPLVRNGHLLTLSSGLSAIVGFAFWTVAAWKYDAATVGSNSAAISMMTLIAAIAGFNLLSVVVRFVPTAGRRTRRLVAGVYLVSGGAALVVGICSVALVRIVSPGTNFLEGAFPRAMFVFATIAYTIFVVQDGVLTALHRTALVPLANFLFGVAKLGLLVVLAGILPGHGIFTSMALSLGGAVLVVGTFLFGWAIPRLQYGTTEAADTLPPVRQLVRFVAFDYTGTICSIGAISLMPILVIAVLGAEQNAYFAIAWLISYSVLMINLNMGTSLVVESAADQSQLARQARHMLAHTSKLLVLIVLPLVLAAPYLLGIFGDSYRTAGDTLRLLVLAALPNLVVMTGISLARAQRRMGLVFGIEITQCVLLIPLTWLLLPVMGIAGAGLAWLITQSLIACGLFIRRDSWLPVDLTRAARTGDIATDVTVEAVGEVAGTPVAITRPEYGGYDNREAGGALSTHQAPRTFRELAPPDEAHVRIDEHGSGGTLCLERDPAKASVTVVICAYTEQRWDDLVEAVASVQRQTEPPDEIVLVIDYCPGLLQRATQELHGVTVCANRYDKGLSGARNTGISVATCDVVAFLDDDAAAAPDWLAALVAPYADSRVIGVGGRVRPNWQSERPRWFPSEFDWVVGCSYRGLPTETAPVRNFIGANMSLLRRVLVESGGFDTGLGRIASRPLGCEETELCIRVARTYPDAVHLYEPAAEVLHNVPDLRGTWSYFRERCYAEGLSKAVVSRLAGANRALASEQTYLSSTIPRGFLRYVGEGLRGRLWGFAAALAMVVGVTATVAGYAVGTVRTTVSKAQTTVSKAKPTVSKAQPTVPKAKRIHFGRWLARVGPLAGLPIALALWLVSLPRIDLDRIGDYGLIPLLPLTFWLALAVLLVAFSVLVRRATTPTPLLVGHVLTLIAILHATPSLIEGTLRYPWAWKHVGLIDYFLRNNGVDSAVNEMSAYQYWPGFFNVNAMLVKAGGLQTSLHYAVWAPPFFNVLLIGPLFLIFRTFTGDRRLIWSAILIFFLGSWVGQDYFAPQACAYFLYLTVIAVCLRYLGRHGDVRARDRRLLVGLAVVPMIAAIVPTHQLTPLMAVCGLGVLAVFCRQRVWLLLLLMIGLTVGWDLIFAAPWIAENRQGIMSSIGTLGANASSGFINLADASPSQAVVAQVDRVHSAGLWALAFVGFVRRFRGRRELALPLLALAPIPLIVSNDYGGEMIFRVFLFGLPFVAFYAAAAFFPRETAAPPSGRHWRRRMTLGVPLALPAVLLLLVPGFAAGYYGKEQENYLSPQEVSAAQFVYGIAPRGSLLLGADDFPLAFVNYEFYDSLRFAQLEPQDRQALVNDPVATFSDMMSAEKHDHAYLLLSRSQAAAVKMTGALPPGALARIEQALTHSPRFTVIFRNQDAVVITLNQPPPEATP